MFRRQVEYASVSSEVTYADPDRRSSGMANVYSFTGELQAIQDNSSIWLNNGKTSVRAEMEGVRVYFLPSSGSIEKEDRIEENKIILPRDMPKRLKWERVYSLMQGTGFLLSGSVFVENGIPVFRHTDQQPLLAVIYDGQKETVLRRSIWSGRQLNEYWNNLTPLSLIAGSFSLFVLTFLAFRQGSYNSAAMLSVLTFAPVLPFVPPGLAFYFFFRRFWRSGRYLRGERDLLRLPLRHPHYTECASCGEALEQFSGVKIRSCGVIDEADLLSCGCRVYTSEAGESKIPKHFSEELIIPGDPVRLAEKCRSRARVMEVLAAASISLGFLINMILIYLVLVRLL